MKKWLLFTLLAASMHFGIRASADQKQSELTLQQPGSAGESSPQQFFDIHGPVPLPAPPDWTLYLIIAILLLLLLGSIAFFLRNRLQPKPAPPIPPHRTALADLATARQFLEQSQSLRYGRQVSGILRRYIEERFGISSTKQTSSELLNALESAPQTSGHSYSTALRGCLEQCDLAKYAHKENDQESMENIERSVITFIEQTSEEAK